MSKDSITIKAFSVGYLQTNCYVISDGNVCVVVDPGGGADKIKQYISDNGFKLKAVLLTHGHFDHILALSEIQKAGAKVYIHSDDEKMLHNEWNLASDIGLKPLPDVNADVVLCGGEDLTFGTMHFKVMHTPGHTQGGCAFDLESSFLFTGDTLLADSYGRTDFYGGSFSSLVNSIHDIFALDGDRVVYPGHGESTTLLWEREHNPIAAL